MGPQEISDTDENPDSTVEQEVQADDKIDIDALFSIMENTEDSLFITGRAGTGKSTLLKRFVEDTRKKVVVLAPTGLAAVNVNGQTIHSFFALPPAIPSNEDLLAKRNPVIYKKMDTLIIDEVSMVRADLFDAMDKIMRINCKHHDKPFGGVQLILFGDMFQLPPVVEQSIGSVLKEKLGYDSAYFFSAHVFKELKLKTIELDKVYRQKDHEFIDFLDKIRKNTINEEDLEYVNQRVGKDLPEELQGKEVILATRNYIVDTYNNAFLQRLPGSHSIYTAKISGEFRENENPAEKILRLKKGARVIFIRNDNEGRWVNGTLGTVHDMEDNFVHVRIDGSAVSIPVPMIEWNKVRHRFDYAKNDIVKEEIGVFKQFPLRLAWALTIHKSQGQTFEALLLDLSSSVWEHGQLYVALSRCKTLDGLVLRKQVTLKDVIVDPKIVEFFTRQDDAMAEKRVYYCGFRITGAKSEMIEDARSKSIAAFQRIGYDFSPDLSYDGWNKVRIGQTGKTRCGICNYLRQRIKDEIKDNEPVSISFEDCKARNEDYNLNARPSPNEYFKNLLKSIGK